MTHEGDHPMDSCLIDMDGVLAHQGASLTSSASRIVDSAADLAEQMRRPRTCAR
jgi:hypothetical protein